MRFVLILLAVSAWAQVPLPGGGASGGGTNGIPLPYMGLVATRGDLPNSTAGGVTWLMVRNIHYARQTIPANSARMIWGNYYVTSANVETGVGPMTIKASIEYPVGAIAGLCTISGSTTPTIPALADAVTDSCPHVTIPNGAAFWIRTLQTNDSGIVFTAGHYGTPASYDAAMFGSGTPSDLVLSGTVTGGGDSGVQYTPLAIIGSTVHPSVCLVGDSRVTGEGDTPNDATRDTGELARSIGPVWAYTRLAVTSTVGSAAITNFTARLRIIAYCSHVIDEYGINDIAGGQSAASVASTRTSLAALFARPTWGTTLPTSTSSTDSWATTTNQTAINNPSVVSSFNTLERTGVAGEFGFFDVANAVDPLGLGKWPVSKIVGSTSGTAFFATPDGIHESTAMNVIIQQSGAVNTSWIYRR